VAPSWSADGKHIFYRRGKKISRANIVTTPTPTISGHKLFLELDKNFFSWRVLPGFE
jgi:hypothetical protein